MFTHGAAAFSASGLRTNLRVGQVRLPHLRSYARELQGQEQVSRSSRFRATKKRAGAPAFAEITGGRVVKSRPTSTPA